MATEAIKNDKNDGSKKSTFEIDEFKKFFGIISQKQANESKNYWAAWQVVRKELLEL